jgi:hypothetical protein
MLVKLNSALWYRSWISSKFSPTMANLVKFGTG